MSYVAGTNEEVWTDKPDFNEGTCGSDAAFYI